MKKIIIAAVLTITFLLPAAGRTATLKKIASVTKSGFERKSDPKVAVLSFIYKGGGINSGTELVRRELIKHYSFTDGYTVVPKDLCDMIIARFLLDEKESLDRMISVEIGKLLDADILVTGYLKDKGSGNTKVKAVIIDSLRAEVIDKVTVKIEKVWQDEPRVRIREDLDYSECAIPLDYIELLVDYEEFTQKQTSEVQMKPGDSIQLIAAPGIDSSDREEMSKTIIGFSPKWSAISGRFVPGDRGSKVKYVYSGPRPAEFEIRARQINYSGEIVEGKLKVIVSEE